jgi:putative hemolysin
MFKPQSPIKQSGFSLLFIILVIAAFIVAGSTAAYFMIIENNYKETPVPPVRYQTPEEKAEESKKMNKNPLYDGATLANPASEYCIKAGGTLQSETRGDGGEYSICNFEDDQSCEEWALFRKQCPVGGVKTIGYDNPEEVYCVQIGGQTTAVSDSKCTLPGGKVCSNLDLYNGKCQ